MSSTDWRGLCGELYRAFTAHARTDKQHDLLDRVQGALAQPEPEVVGPSDGPAVPDGREPASVVGEPSDEELLQMTTPATITPEQLEAHRKWVNGAADGTRLVLTGADLTGAVLRGADLRGADLFGADLTHADLTGAVLTHAILTHAVLTGAVLTRAVLTCAVLTGADLRGADLFGADLTHAVLTGADLTHAVLTGAILTHAVLTGAVLTRADLTGADLRGAIGLPVAADAAERLQAVARAALEPNALEMEAWHACETTHCMAGWAVHLAGEPGRLLEASVGPEVAGLYLLGAEAHRYFFESNEKAREFLQGVLKNA